MRITFWAVSLLQLISFVYSKKGNARPSISINGQQATAGQFPYMASLPFPLGSCGGTLIAPSYVLTAAHCVSIYQQSELKDSEIYLNTLNVTGGEANSVTAYVSSFVVHEGYSNVGTGFVNDVALLVLSLPVKSITPVPLPKESTTTMKATTKHTTPHPTTKPTTPHPTTKPTTPHPTTPHPTIKTTTHPSGSTLSCTCTQTEPTSASGSMKLSCTCTPQGKQRITKANPTTKKPALGEFGTYANMTATVTGWGIKADGFNSDMLMYSTVTIFDNVFCTTQWGSTLFNGNSMMCASKDGISACMDDDGGPILVDGVQVGITSFVPEKCGDPNFPAVFTRVTPYLSWINRAMAANRPPNT